MSNGEDKKNPVAHSINHLTVVLAMGFLAVVISLQTIIGRLEELVVLVGQVLTK